MMAIAIVSMPGYARVIRSTVLSVRETDYVEASRALGASNYQILFKRILPNAVGPIDYFGYIGYWYGRIRHCCTLIFRTWRTTPYTRMGHHA